jgi:hypothetical protein
VIPLVNTHWTHGGTGLTNFTTEDLHKYERAVEAVGDPRMVLHKDPMLPMLPGSGGSLHCLDERSKGRSEICDKFWRTFYKVNELQDPSIAYGGSK